MKKLAIFVLSCVALVACGPVTTDNNGQDAQPDSEVMIDSPSANAVVSSPLEISGSAPGYWYFEAMMSAELQDADGEVISSGTLTAQSDWMTEELVGFEGSLEFTTDAEEGNLVIRKANPSGLPENEEEYSIPLQFE